MKTNIPWKKYTSYLWAVRWKTKQGDVSIELRKRRWEHAILVIVNDRQFGHYRAHLHFVDPPDTWNEASLCGLQFLKMLGWKPPEGGGK